MEGGLVGQVSLRAVSLSEPPQRPCVGGQQLGRADRPQRSNIRSRFMSGSFQLQCSKRKISQLHAVPQKTATNGEYYRSNILASECLEALNRTAKEGSVPELELMYELTTLCSCRTMHQGLP